MPRPRHERFKIAERRARVAERLTRGGRRQFEVATELGISEATVSRDVKAIEAEWHQQAVKDVAERKAVELAKINLVEREAWEAWDRSKQDAETLRVRQRGTGEDTETETEKVVRSQYGDPRFLDVVLECVNLRWKLLGLDKASGASTSCVTVVGGIDLDVVVGNKPGLPADRRNALLE